MNPLSPDNVAVVGSYSGGGGGGGSYLIDEIEIKIAPYARAGPLKRGSANTFQHIYQTFAV